MVTSTSVRPAPLLDLAMAVIASSNTPLLLLAGNLTVVAASASFYRAFELTAAKVRGRSIFDLGGGEWNEPRLRSLLTTTLSGLVKIDAYEIDLVRLNRDPRRLVLNAQTLVYDDPANVRLLLAVSDVTDARESERIKDDLLREKALMLEEVQHRVANSLQIIASVLMQSARTVNSDETRLHLRDAHNRVMSVAAVQRQLAISKVGDVSLRTYFIDLCKSIAASMITEDGRLSLSVTGDDSVGNAQTSVSLGLIVTELVINSLKHAFTGRDKGVIIVDYRSLGIDWTLSVCDDGTGMPAVVKGADVGLGTTIVTALAKQLHAAIEVVDTKPGTMVRVRRNKASAAAVDALPYQSAI